MTDLDSKILGLEAELEKPQLLRKRSASESKLDELTAKKPESDKKRDHVQNEAELKSGTKSIIDFGDSDTAVTLDSKTEGVTKRFEYDRMFRPYSTQQEVYESVGKPVVESVISGINAAIIAYGQTGSGKTYTMLGPGFDGGDDRKTMGDPGVIPRVMRSLFERVAEMESDQNEYRMRASYVEIYKEVIYDLIAPRLDNRLRGRQNEKQLQIKQDPHRGLWLPEATEVPVQNLADVFAVLRLGSANRAVAETNSNEHSSRSHAIFMITLEARHHDTRITNLSQLYLVDLAGSEQVNKTGATGERLKEAQSINQSLSALGLVIFALSGLKSQKKVFVPYRNSKLTRLLQNCLGGNARTSLVICASPSAMHAQETLSTLRFGERTQQIKNAPKVNAELSFTEMKALLRQSEVTVAKQAAIIKQLENEIKVLQQMQSFDLFRQGGSTSPARGTAPLTITDGNSAFAPVPDGKRSAWGAWNDAGFQTPEKGQGQGQQRPQTAYGGPKSVPVARGGGAGGSGSGLGLLAGPASGGQDSARGGGKGGSGSGGAGSAAAAGQQRPTTAGPALQSVPVFERSSSGASSVDSAGAGSARGHGHHPRSASAGGKGFLSLEDGDPEDGEDGTPSENGDGSFVVDPDALVPAKQQDGIAAALAHFATTTQQQEPAATTVVGKARRYKIPDIREMIVHFICPLSKYIMTDPVMALDGFTYERRAIELHMSKYRESPMTGKKLGGKLLIPNHNLLLQIRKFYPNAPKQQRVSGFQLLAVPVVTLLFSFLDHKSLSRVGGACLEFSQINVNERLWRNLCLKLTKEPVPELPEGETYKQLFQSKYQAAPPKDYSNFVLQTRTRIGQVVVVQKDFRPGS